MTVLPKEEAGLSLDTFTRFLRHEIERARVAPGPATVGVLRLLPAKSGNGPDPARLLEEVAGLLKPNLPAPNLLAVSHAHHALLLLLPGTDQPRAEVVLRDFESLVRKLLTGVAHSGGALPGVRVAAAAIKPGRSESDLLHTLLS